MSAGRAYADFELVRRLFLEARPFWLHIGGLAALSLLSTPLALLAPLPLMITVDSVLGDKALPRWLLPVLPSAIDGSGRDGALLIVVGMVLAVALATLLHGLIHWVLSAYTGERLLMGLRAKLFRHVQDLPFTHHMSAGSTDSIYRIQYDTYAIQTVTTDSSISLISSVLTLIAMLGVTGRIDWLLALIALAVVPAMFLLTRYSSRILRKRWGTLKDQESSAMSVVQETLAALQVVKAFGTEDREQQRFVSHSGKVVRGQVGIALTQGGFDVFIGLTVAAGTAAALFVGVRHVQEGVISLGELLLIMAYLAQLYAPLQSISKRIGELQSSLASAERVFSILDSEPHVAERVDALHLGKARGAIDFQEVSFSYRPESVVIRNVSFSIPAGKRVGIYGQTGAGKSTLVGLLLRFYDPQHGRVLLDGVDLRDYRLMDLRNQFAMVLQEPVLFSTSIAENIAYARPGAREDEIVAAAKMASAHDFIVRMPNGYATPVGERGMQLSGGERQRISLARAFLRDAPILILDEPTSSIDLRTEATIVDSMERLMQGRTTFIIAHRLSTLEHCDILLKMERGQLVGIADGTQVPVREFLKNVSREAALRGGESLMTDEAKPQ